MHSIPEISIENAWRRSNMVPENDNNYVNMSPEMSQ